MKWVFDNWAKIGGLTAMCILFYVFLMNEVTDHRANLFWLHLVTLLLHQYEEYVYPGGFKDFFNKNIAGRTRLIRLPLNDYSVFLINVIIGWSAYLYSALLSIHSLWLAYGLLGVTLLNGILHTIMFLIKKKYNPGFITGLFIQIPFAIYFFIILNNGNTIQSITSGMVVFFLAIFIIPFTIFLAHFLHSSKSENTD